MNFLKRTLPLIIAFSFGILGITLKYIPHQASEDLIQTLTKWITIIFAFAAFMGSYSLLSLHYHRMKRKNEGWGYSVLLYLGFALMLIFGIYNNGSWVLSPRAKGGGVDWLYDYVYNPSQATMFSMLAFFIASAAYRTFRAKTIEAALLLVAAIIVMFGQVPISNLVSDKIPGIAQWLLAYPNLAVKRAIFFGVCMGMVATSLRIIFGIERSYLGGE